MSSLFVYYIQKTGLFSEIRRVIQKVLRVLINICDNRWSMASYINMNIAMDGLVTVFISLYSAARGKMIFRDM